MSKAGPPLADRFACQLWSRVVLGADYLADEAVGALVTLGDGRDYEKIRPGLWRLAHDEGGPVGAGDGPVYDRGALLALINRKRAGSIAKRMELSGLSEATAAGVLRKIMRGERPLVRFGKADRFASVLGCDVSALFAEPEIAALRAWRKWCAL